MTTGYEDLKKTGGRTEYRAAPPRGRGSGPLTPEGKTRMGQEERVGAPSGCKAVSNSIPEGFWGETN